MGCFKARMGPREVRLASCESLRMRATNEASGRSPPARSATERRLDPFALVAVGLLGGGLAVVEPGPVALGTLVAVVAARRLALASRGVGWLVGAVVVLGALRAHLALGQGDTRYARAVSVARPPALCTLRATIARSPVHQGGVRRAVARVVDGTCEHPERGDEMPLFHEDLLDLFDVPAGAVRGDELALTAELGAVSRFANEGSGDRRWSVARGGAALRGKIVFAERIASSSSLGAIVDRARDHVRGRIEATVHPEAAPLSRALVLGESDLDDEVNDAFRVTGLAHLLAVSGTHLMVAIVTLLSLARAVAVRIPALAARWDVERGTSALGIPLALLYADFTGQSGSVLRAAWMLAFALLVRALGRRPRPARVVGWALIAAWVVDPLAALDVSFLLSLSATVGLLVLSRPIGERLGGVAPPEASLARRAWAAVAGPLSATLAASLACAPVTALLSPTAPVVGLFANLVAAPLGELVALPFGLIHAISSPIPALERGLALVESGALRAVLFIARAAAATGIALPVVSPTGWQLAALPWLALLVVAARCDRSRRHRSMLGVLVLGALELGARLEGAPSGLVRVSALDVGQGDALLVDLPDRSAVLVDGGGIPGAAIDVGERVILPVLRQRRRSRLHAVVLTHAHPDHYGGLASVLENVEVGELWVSGEPIAPEGPVARLLSIAARRGVVVRTARELCDAPRSFEGAVVEVLAPCERDGPELAGNDASLVLRVRHGDHAALLVGDLEEEGERRLLERAEPRASLLKVGHHGSRTSTTEALLGAVQPQTALVSCGVRNRFGHPHRETLAALSERGVELGRTDQSGEVRWTTDGRAAWLDGVFATLPRER
jgi:competence protein ComEC